MKNSTKIILIFLVTIILSCSLVIGFYLLGSNIKEGLMLLGNGIGEGLRNFPVS